MRFCYILFAFGQLVSVFNATESLLLRSQSVELSDLVPIYLKTQSCPDPTKSTRITKFGVCITACIFHPSDPACQSTLETVISETDTEIITNYSSYSIYSCGDPSGNLLSNQIFTYPKTCVNGLKYSLASDESQSHFDVRAGGALNYHFFDSFIGQCYESTDSIDAVWSQFQENDHCSGPVYNPFYDKVNPLYWKMSCTGSVLSNLMFYTESSCNSANLVSTLSNLTIGKCTDLTGTFIKDTETMYCYEKSPIQIKSTSKSTSTTTSCFAGSETVLLSSGETKLISKVEIGDMVQGATKMGDILFSIVIAIPHAFNHQKAEFIHLMTVSHKSIKVTPDHFILASINCNDQHSAELMLASNINTQMCILTRDGFEKVITVENAIDYGVYSIVLMNTEYIMVNGIVASPFANNHAVTHAFYNIHRAMYYLMGNKSILSNNMTGLNTLRASAMEVLASMIV